MKDTNRGIHYALQRAIVNTLLLLGVRPLIFCLNALFPPSTRNVVFFANKSVWGDNIACFYDHLAQDEHFEAHIICSDARVTKMLQARFPDRVSHAYSLQAVRHFLAAYFIVISHSTKIRHFAPFYMCLSQKHVLNLWHGIPLKRLNNQIRGYKTRQNLLQRQDYSSFAVCSDLEKLIICCCFDMQMDDVIVTNTPRNDLLLETEFTPILSEVRKDYRHILLYAPTWREEGEETRLFPFDDFDSRQLDDFLDSMEALVLVRHHIETSNPSHETIKGMRNVRFADQAAFPNTQELLRETDAVITDYSSIFLDFLLLDRPVVHVPYDEAKYNRYRGFMLEYDDVVAGPKVYSQAEFLEQVRFAIQEPKQHSERRRSLRDRFHRHVDGKASARIVDYMHAVAKDQ